MVAVGESGVVVRITPDQQPAGGSLGTVSIFAEMLVFQAFAHNFMTDEVAQGLEA